MSAFRQHNSSFESCCICLEDYNADAALTDTTVTHCGHKFHHVCLCLHLMAAQTHECPWCKAPIELEGVMPVAYRAFVYALKNLHNMVNLEQTEEEHDVVYARRMNALLGYANQLGLEPHVVQYLHARYAQMPIH